MLMARVRVLIPRIVDAAQAEYDDWHQDEDGLDDACGSGGICDRIADAIASVVGELEGVDIIDGGHEGDDHAYIVVLSKTEAVSVDIPPDVYETGAGYSWRKRRGVRIAPDDVVLQSLPRRWFDEQR